LSQDFHIENGEENIEHTTTEIILKNTVVDVTVYWTTAKTRSYIQLVYEHMS